MTYSIASSTVNGRAREPVAPSCVMAASVEYSLVPSVVRKVRVASRGPAMFSLAEKVTVLPAMEEMDSQDLASSGTSTKMPLPLFFRVTDSSPPSVGMVASSGSMDSTLIRDLLRTVMMAAIPASLFWTVSGVPL